MTSSDDPHDGVRQYVIYYDPRDYPEKFVLRGWSISPGEEPVPDRNPLLVADSLREAREAVPPGLYRLPRFRNDDVAILEVWV